MRKKYKNLIIGLATMNFSLPVINAGTSLDSKILNNISENKVTNFSKDKAKASEQSLNSKVLNSSEISNDKTKNNSGEKLKTSEKLIEKVSTTLKTPRANTTFFGNVQTLALLASGAVLGSPTLNALSFLGKKIFYSKNGYYLTEIERKASDWTKVEDIIMSSAYAYLASSKDLWKDALNKLKREVAEININDNTNNFDLNKKVLDKIKDAKIKDLQDKFSKEITEFREFVYNRLDQKKEGPPSADALVYKGVSDAKRIRDALQTYKNSIQDDEKKHEFDKNEKDLIAWMLICFVDDSSTTNLTYNQLVNEGQGKTIIDKIIKGNTN